MKNISRRFSLYNSLTMKDIHRLWPSVQHHMIIVAGICLPILLLLGLRNGHVAKLREDLLESPSGRQVVFWAGQQGDLMTDSTIEEFEKVLPQVEIIIPEIQRLVRLESTSSSKDVVDNATLYSTRPQDPILSQSNTSISTTGADEIILLESLADALQVKSGGEVRAVIERVEEGSTKAVSLPLKVKSIIPSSQNSENNYVGYVDSSLLKLMEQYILGYQVAKYKWPAANQSAPDTYASYLFFCEELSQLSQEDIRALTERGYQIQRVEDPALRSLHGLLKEESLDQLVVYQLTSGGAAQHNISAAPGELARLTEADDIVVAWNAPLEVEIENESKTLVGISLPSRNWLSLYFKEKITPFDFNASTFSAKKIAVDVVDESLKTATLKSPHGSEVSVEMTTIPAPTPETINPTESEPSAEEAVENTVESVEVVVKESPPEVSDLILVPMDLLALLYAEQSGLAEYDPTIQLFVPVPTPVLFDKARLYAQTIDDVPAVVTSLRDKGYAIMSEESRIREIHQQDHSLQLLVWIVAVSVFVFGTITVFSVLHDSTERKRGSIGILRVMGVSQFGLFYMVFLRAAIIGILAATFSIVVGYGIATFLNWSPSEQSLFYGYKPVILLSITPLDILIIAAGALFCCLLGSLIPARRASSMDPFEAIIEGRFR
ncbi:MAG: FtsX-like permease family protein [Planctomycetaceae bacterium]